MIHGHATCDACHDTEIARNRAVALLARWARTRDTTALRLDVGAFLATMPDLLKQGSGYAAPAAPGEPTPPDEWCNAVTFQTDGTEKCCLLKGHGDAHRFHGRAPRAGAGTPEGDGK